MDTFSLVIVIILCGICALLASVPLLAVLGDKMFEKYKREYREYREYGSPKDLDEIWDDRDQDTVCSACGMGDSPAFPHWLNGDVCKYCFELSCLTKHINEQKRRNVRDYYYY